MISNNETMIFFVEKNHVSCYIYENKTHYMLLRNFCVYVYNLCPTFENNK